MIILTCVGIEIAAGVFAIVDAADAALSEGPRWHLHSNGYASRRPGNKGTRQYLHREVRRNAGDSIAGLTIDHINGDRLDCRRSNLRTCSQALNARNVRRKPRHGTTSQYKGVSWDESRSKWFAKITANGRQIALGRYDSEDAAAKAYAEASVRLHGAFGCPEVRR